VRRRNLEKHVVVDDYIHMCACGYCLFFVKEKGKLHESMDPWQDCRRVPTTPVPGGHPDICPNYPRCPRQERKYLNEVRGVGKNVPANFKLSNGTRATDFCLQYIMKTHFKRKIGPRQSKS